MHPLDDDDDNACINDECGIFTTHRSGYCGKCRTRMCSICKKGFVSAEYLPGKTVCANCAQYKKHESKRYNS